MSTCPATLTCGPMTDAEFLNLCEEHQDLRFEMTADGELIIMPPTFSIPSLRNAEIGAQLKAWAKRDGRGLVTDSSGGFVLPDGARYSPDASWISKRRVAQLTDLDGFWHLCPEFVIELRSPSDRTRLVTAKPATAKMEAWVANGAELAWLLDPAKRTVTVYRPSSVAQALSDIDSVAGDGPVAGFVLDLVPIWDPIGQGQV